jgi:endonuclease I
MFNFPRIFRYLIVSLFFTSSLSAQIPEYYSSIDFDTQGTALLTQLTDLITETHINLIPYTSSSTDTWDILRISDLEFVNTSNVLLMYGYDDNDGVFSTDRTRDAYDTCHSSSCIGLWNREHVFAKSLANPSLETNEPGPGTDVHNLRSADSQKNSQRSNRVFTYGSGDSQVLGDYFYPGDEWKGDVARIIMYMYLRYPNQCEAVNSATGPVTYADNNDMPDIFLEWNQEDPISDLELTRNDVIFSYQGNRNPFIDNPFLATVIWGGPQAEDPWGVLTYGSSQVNFKPSLVISDGFVEVIGLNTEPRAITIFNLLGQSLLQSSDTKAIDISPLSTGVYVARIEQSGQHMLIKFVVN